MPNGTVLSELIGLRKDNTGYDLAALFLGAEGTLGLITAAVLRLFPRPSARQTAWLAVPSAAAAYRARHGREISERVHGLAVELGGSFGAEHGVGQLKTAELERYASVESLTLMRTLKQALDPGAS